MAEGNQVHERTCDHYRPALGARGRPGHRAFDIEEDATEANFPSPSASWRDDMSEDDY